MAYRELTMIDVKEVLRRWAAGQSNREIGRGAGVDHETAGRYAKAAIELALPRDRALTEDEVHEVAKRVQARAVPDASVQWKAVAAHKERIEEWLGKKRPLKLTKIHVLLQRDGLEASYDTLRRYAAEELGWHKKPSTIRLGDPPAGQEAQVDFGRMGPLFDPDAGRVRTLWALIVTLAFSRYQFVWPTFVQTTAAVCILDDATVHSDHHAHVASALYSVPHAYLEKKVCVRADKTVVKIYFGTELIKVHQRQPPGGRSTDTKDYPEGKADYALRSVDGLIAKAREKGAHVGAA